MDKRILIIDDNPQDRKIMTRFLNRAGFAQVSTAENGAEGVRKVGEEKPDLVILDTMLPDMLGFEVCSRIRENYGANEPKIIMTTGAVDAVDALKARQVGANDYCVKTSDCSPLMSALENLYK
jgi:two-component system sensor histidine kinase ChiS